MNQKKGTDETKQAEQTTSREPVKENPAAAAEDRAAIREEPPEDVKEYTIGEFIQDIESSDDETRQAKAEEIAEKLKGYLDDESITETINKAFSTSFAATLPAISAITSNAFRAISSSAAVYSSMHNSLEIIGSRLVAITELLKEQREEEEAFFKTETWATLKREFPTITEEDGAILYWVDLINPILNNTQALKRKIANYEQETGQNLIFEDLLSIRAEDENKPRDVLLERFLDEIAEEAERSETAVKLQSPGTPKYYTIINTVFNNALRAIDGKGEVIGAGDILLPVLYKDTPREVPILVNVSLENMEGVTLTGKPYTEYDRAIQDAVCSLYVDRINRGLPPIATKKDIYRTMTHKTSSEKVNPQQAGAVAKSVDKQRKNIYAEIDATAEMVARKAEIDGKPITQLKISDFLLSAKEITVEISGKKETAYLFSEPLQLTYAKANKQLYTVPGSLLDIKRLDSKGNITAVSMPNTDSRISIRSCLLRRVLVMISDEEQARDAYRKYENRRQKKKELKPRSLAQFRKQSRNIVFDYVFTAAEIENKNRKTDARNYILTVLENWKTVNYKNTGHSFIKGFSEYPKKGKGAKGITIELW